MNKCLIHRPQVAFTINKVNYYGASFIGAPYFKGDLILNFTLNPNFKYSMDPELAKYMINTTKEFLIPWRDMEAPNVKMKFWQQLHLYVEQKKFKNVCFNCNAGHGRTGTALSAMLIANSAYSADQAVSFVRESYCKEAVETFEQTEYLVGLDKLYNKRKYNKNSIVPLPTAYFAFLANEQVSETEDVVLNHESDEEQKIIFG